MTSTTPTGPAQPRETGFRSTVPKGVRLDEPSFRSRHRIISAVLAVHLPGLAVFGLV